MWFHIKDIQDLQIRLNLDSAWDCFLLRMNTYFVIFVSISGGVCDAESK